MNKDLQKFVENNFEKPGKALDLGAGDFEDVDGLKKMGWDCEGVDLKTGVDLEEKYLSKGAPFDLVYSNHVLHFLKNKDNLIQSAYDNLKTGGTFFMQDLINSDLTTGMYWPKKRIEKMIEECGFKITSCRLDKFFDDKPDHMHWHEIVIISAQM